MNDPLTERERKDREDEQLSLERSIQAEHEEWQREQDYECDIAYWWDDES